MKRLLCAVCSVCFLVLSAFSAGADTFSASTDTFPAGADTLSPPSIYSSAYCVMDADTGQVLVGKNLYTEMYPASLTKILTAAMALEVLNPTDSYTFSKEAATYDHAATHLAFSEGETCKIEDLLYGAMVESANDCAQGLADAAAGSVSDFVAQMNEKLAALHCENSHFVNPTGMPDPTHYTSAYDLCLITKYALTVKGFETYFDAWEWTIEPTNKQSEPRVMGTHHAMIVGSENNGAFGYDYAVGGKLGWTEEAKHTIVTVAEKDGVRLICTALKSDSKYDKYKDSIALFDYCFNNFYGVDYAPECAGGLESSDGTAEYVYPDTIRLLLTGGFTAADVTADYTHAADADHPYFTLTVPDNSAMRSDILTYYPDEIAPAGASAETEMPEASPETETEKPSVPWWGWIAVPLGAILILIAVVLCIRFYNIRKYRRLRMNKRKRLAEREKFRNEDPPFDEPYSS